MAEASQDERKDRLRSVVSAFAGRKALVVGGSGGIGAQVSLELSRRQASVTVHGRSRAKAEALCRRITASGGKAEALPYALSAPGDLEAFCQAVSAKGGFDILVVSYGPFIQKSLGEHSPGDWASAALWDLALPGALSSLCLSGMKERGFGRILLFGGTRTDVIRPFSTNAAYAAAKTGLGVLAKSLAAEGADRNVAAVLACPGFVRTEYLDEASAARLAAKAPRSRLLDASSLAAAALDLLDSDPCAASGAIVSFDGGLTL